MPQARLVLGKPPPPGPSPATVAGEAAAARARFIRIQIVKGGLGAVFAAAYMSLFGMPDLAEGLAFFGLVAPLSLAVAARLAPQLNVLESISLTNFAVLIALLSAYTGGVSSPFAVWLVLVPFEGSLSGNGRMVTYAACAASVVLIVLAALGLADAIPASRLDPHFATPVLGAVLFGAIVQGALMCIEALKRKRATDLSHMRALVEARDAAEDASRAKSLFLANMSHELRTPLNAILGFSEVMTHEMFGALGSPRYVEYARVINESGTHLLDLINSVLDMSKIEAGKFVLTPEHFEFSETVAQAIRLVRHQADRREVKLESAIAPEFSFIFADKRATLQILVNLLSNGVKFTPRTGSVVVSASRIANEGIEICVTDTGTGISPEDLQRLGRPFEQGENAYSRSTEGTGLGLALVRSLTGLHGGEMTIESELGEGTTVRVALPGAAHKQRIEKRDAA